MGGKLDVNASELYNGVRSDNRTILSRAITLIESRHPDHQSEARALIEKCLPHTGNAIRIGITGVPGVGKSTFIESFGKHLTNSGLKIAVLAIDPSSKQSGGSILGDKTRMNELSIDKNAFIRPTAAGKSIGGVSRATRETIMLFEAADYDVILVETVGVGQSEISVHGMVDCFVLLMLAGAGDELQGIKRGIIEMTDIMVINKADGDNLNNAKKAAKEYVNALHLFPIGESKWNPKVEIASGLNSFNVDGIWALILEYKAHCENNGYWEKRRSDQSLEWLSDSINMLLSESFYCNEKIQNLLTEMKTKVQNNELSSFSAAKQIVDDYLDK